MLLCVGGCGWRQEEGRKAAELTPGKVVNIPPEAKHWHGAASDSRMTYLVIEVAGKIIQRVIRASIRRGIRQARISGICGST